MHLLFLLRCIVRCSSSYTGIAKRTRNIFRNMFVSWLLAVWFGAVCLQGQFVASLEVQNHDLQLVYEWKYLNYLYESNEQAQGYIKENNFPIDVDVSPDGRTFVTVIRDKGVPSSLNTVSYQHGDGGPLLKPYPNWDAAKTDCSGIYSVYRVAICQNVLYVIDNGKLNEKQICPPRLYMFDLWTDKILKNLTIPTDVATNTTTNNTLLATPIVDCCGAGEKNVYIADVEGFAIVVYRHDTGKFHRITGGPLNYDQKAVTYTINGESFQLQDGAVGMAWSCSKSGLFLSPMSSYNMVFVGQDALDNSKGDAPMRNFPDILPTQSSAKAMSYSGTLFFGLVNSTSIACWNENRPLTSNNMVIIAQDSELLQFTSGLKVVEYVSLFGLSEQLYALTNRYQKIATGTLNMTEVNFRILKGSVSLLTYGTRCASAGW